MFNITKIGDDINSRKIREFIADTVSDIDKLPHINSRGTQGTNNDPIDDCVAAGSTCLVIETSAVYMLNNADVWTEI